MPDGRTVFVTWDARVIAPGPHGLDPDDELANPSRGAAMTPAEAMRLATDPGRPATRARLEPAPGVALSPERLEELAAAASRAAAFFEDVLRPVVRGDVALEVRRLRVDEGRTWRGVARAMHGWLVFNPWTPPSNQLAGVALCKLAAGALGEDWWSAPWN